MKLRGYERPDGTYGIRNHLLILPTSVCSSEVAKRIADAVPEAVAIPHQHGCCQIGEDYKQTLRTLIGFGCNPNVGAVLVVALGCEGIRPDAVTEELVKTGKPVREIVIQKCGGTTKAVAKGVEAAQELAGLLRKMKRTEFDPSHLILGLECGGSDPTSGIAANPAVGVASNHLIDAGGTSILSETTEIIGAEHILAKRCTTEKCREDLLFMVKRIEEKSIASGVDLRETQPTPGNIEGGLSSIEEKSLGCIHKAGDKPLIGVLEYAQMAGEAGHGLYFMDTPGEDIDSITGMVAGGAQVVIFTTGLGTPTGCAIAPVIKVTGNPGTYKNMEENIDINAGKIITHESTMEEAGQEIYDFLLQVADGTLTKAEKLGHKEFAIYRIGDTY
ncbi:MAG: UxaA family hydrolase [Blautia sp.]|jgi:altronate dehydratase large subunit